MKILTNLPVTSKEYFRLYKVRAYTELVGEGDLEAIIGELRLAYKKYPKSQQRILQMVGTIKRGIGYPLPKHVNAPVKNKYKNFSSVVKEKLF